jgi:hypothetical protein
MISMTNGLRHNVEQITEMALKYLKEAGHPFAKVMKVTHDGPSITGRPGKAASKPAPTWHVEADIGTVRSIKKRLQIDDRTGKVIKFE